MVMNMSWHGSTFHITGPLWGESTNDQSIPITKGSNAELWWFLYCQHQQVVDQTLQTKDGLHKNDNDNIETDNYDNNKDDDVYKQMQMKQHHSINDSATLI